MAMFSKFKKGNVADAQDLVASTKNWYRDRYESVVMQRNVLFLFVVASIIALAIGVIVVGKITITRNIEPFVIEVEDKTGIVSVVNPTIVSEISGKNALDNYFVMTYVRARETYNVGDYNFNYNTLVRLFSISGIYSQFRSLLNDDNLSPIKKYGSNNSTILKLRSINYLEANKTAQVRFTIIETANPDKKYNKVATITYSYQQLSLNQEDRLINPLGFQVTSYSVSDEFL